MLGEVGRITGSFTGEPYTGCFAILRLFDALIG